MRELEDLVISATGSSLLVANLNHAAQSVDVSSVAPIRDVPPGSAATMISLLEEWDAKCTNLLGELDAKVRAIKSRATEDRRRAEDLDNKIKKVANGAGSATGVASLRGGGQVQGSGKRGMAGEADEMDLDEKNGGSSIWARSAKRGGKLMGGLDRKLGGD